MQYWIVKHGDQALAIELEPVISISTSQKVQTISRYIQKMSIPGVKTVVFAFCSISLTYDPYIIAFHELSQLLHDLLQADTIQASVLKKEIMIIPVCYEGEHQLDLEAMSRYTQLSSAEIITRHTTRDYRIYALGFLPGFAYLGGLDQHLAMPRLSSPRKQIAKGSVGIAGEQTGIYPLASPGGWNIIGQTPLNLFDPMSQPPVPFQPGQWLRFMAVSPQMFDEIAEAVLAHKYRIEWLEEDNI